MLPKKIYKESRDHLLHVRNNIARGHIGRNTIQSDADEKETALVSALPRSLIIRMILGKKRASW